MNELMNNAMQTQLNIFHRNSKAILNKFPQWSYINKLYT